MNQRREHKVAAARTGATEGTTVDHVSFTCSAISSDGSAGDLRVLQNAKIKASGAVRASHDAQVAALSAVAPDSLLRVLARADPEEWRNKLELSEDQARRALIVAERYVELVQGAQ